MKKDHLSMALIVSAIYFIDVLVSASVYYVVYKAGTGFKCLLVFGAVLSMVTIMALLEER